MQNFDSAADAAMLSQDEVKQGSRTIFLQSMERGVPEASQILFKVHVSVGDQGPVAGSVAGANTALKNPAARYVIDYTADPGTIGLTQNSAGAWQGQITALAIAYDHDGNRLN